MDIVKVFKTDSDTEVKGKKIEFAPGQSITVAREGNEKHKTYLRERIKPYQNLMDAGGELPIVLMQGIIVDGLVEAVLLGWEGIEWDGAAFDYSKDNARKALTELPDFFKLVVAESKKLENFKVAQQVSDAKNS